MPAPTPAPRNTDPAVADAPPPLYWLFQLCAAYTLILWLDIVITYLSRSPVNEMSSYFAQGYGMLLAAYASSKQLEKFGNDAPTASDSRLIKGEFFIVLWTVTVMLIGWHSKHYYGSFSAFPKDLLVAYGSVMAVFAGTHGLSAWRTVQFGKRAAAKRDAAPADGGGGDQVSTDPDTAAQAKTVLDFIWTGPHGFTSSQIEEHTKIKKPGLYQVLNYMLAKKMAKRIGKGSGDPNTRYIPYEFHELDPDKPAY